MGGIVGFVLRDPLWIRGAVLFLLVQLAYSVKAQGNNLMVPKIYEVAYADRGLEIDGQAKEEQWQQASYSDLFVDIEGFKRPEYDTRVKMLWDEEFLYVYAEMEEPHVWATLKQRDTVIFYNNDFEVFIDPDGDTHEYYELEINALNTVWDLMLVKPYRNGGSVIDHWDINGLRSAVHIMGTLNDASDLDRGWSVEIALPWEVLKEAAGTAVPPSGDFWRMNFSRVNWEYQLDSGQYSRKKNERGEYLPEYNWVWSPQQVVNMHEPERWGYVYFVPDKGHGNFSIPEREYLKWELYAVYRKLIANDSILLKQVQAGEHLLAPIVMGETAIPVIVEFHQSGWNLIGEWSETGDLVIIRQDGKFVKSTKR